MCHDGAAKSLKVVAVRCWRPICTILDDGTLPPAHTNGANETEEHLVLHCLSHDQAWRGNRNFRSQELSLPGAKVPWNIRSQERKFHGTFVPGSEISLELSFPRAKVPWNFRRERKFHGTFAPKREKTIGNLYYQKYHHILIHTPFFIK